MRLFSFPTAVLGLLAIAYLPSTLAKPYPVHDEETQRSHNAGALVRKQLAKVNCPAPGQNCGFYGQICCASGQTCGENANKEAICVGGSAGGQGWQFYTTTWVETVGLVTYTSVYSSYVGGVAAQPTGNSCAAPSVTCGTKCCPGGFYCDGTYQCKAIAGGSSGGILPTLPGTLQPSAPLRPTSSGLVVVTYTGRPTVTAPFQTPIPTGAAGGGPVPVAGAGGGLSGGAIAGIVIGVLLGLLLLSLICLFCCARALFDTVLAIFGLGKKKKHTHEETTYIEEHHSGGAAGGGRWYGQGRPARPSRVGSEKKSGVAKKAGVAAALGGLALMLGLKRKHDRKHDDKSTTVSGSSYYYSDYTSSSKFISTH
jgi:hypothetical protein